MLLAYKINEESVANYYARVELHGASWPDDYEDLHKALAEHGFTNCATF